MSRVGGDLTHAAVTVDATATGGEQIVAGRAVRKSLIVQNLSTTVDVFVGEPGASGVTTANGIKIGPGQSLEFTDYSGPLSGVVASGSADVRYMEVH